METSETHPQERDEPEDLPIRIGVDIPDEDIEPDEPMHSDEESA